MISRSVTHKPNIIPGLTARGLLVYYEDKNDVSKKAAAGRILPAVAQMVLMMTDPGLVQQ